MSEKTSLQKSHSKSSNFKLTLLCIFTIIFFSLCLCMLSLIKSDTVNHRAAVIASAVSGALAFLGFVRLISFKR